jgi:hypothetical protein
MLMDMELRNLSPLTIKAYLGHVTKFSRMLDISTGENGNRRDSGVFALFEKGRSQLECY